MGLREYCWGAGLILGLASCGQEDSPSLRNVVLQTENAVSSSSGRADFSTVEDPIIKSRGYEPIAGADVKALTFWRDGNFSGIVYLARTASEEGGVAPSLRLPYPEDVAAALRLGLPRGTREGNLDIIISPSTGTVFDYDSSEIVYDLLHWVMGNDFRCDGRFSSKKLSEQRDLTASLLVQFAPANLSEYLLMAYGLIEKHVSQGLVPDLPPGEEWYALYPANPTVPPIRVRGSTAEDALGPELFQQLQDACGKSSETLSDKDLEHLRRLCEDWSWMFQYECAYDRDEKNAREWMSQCRDKGFEDILLQNADRYQCAKESCDTFWTCSLGK